MGSEEDGEDEDDIFIGSLSSEPNTCNFDGISSSTSSSQKYLKVIKYCQNPCEASFQPTDPMCIRTCLCPKNSVLTKDGKCKAMNETIRIKVHEQITKNMNKTWKGGMDNWSPENRSQRDEGMLKLCYGDKLSHALRAVF